MPICQYFYAIHNSQKCKKKECFAILTIKKFGIPLHTWAGSWTQGGVTAAEAAAAAVTPGGGG